MRQFDEAVDRAANRSVGTVTVRHDGKVAVKMGSELEFLVPPAGKELKSLSAGAAASLVLDRQLFVERGEIAIIPDVRFPTFIEDSAHAVRWAADRPLEVADQFEAHVVWIGVASGAAASARRVMR